MISKTIRFHNVRFLAAVILGVCAIVSVAGWSLNTHFAQGQARERVIEKAFTRNSPVEIAEVRVSQKIVELGKTFDADDDWLNTVLLKIKNTYHKPIVFLEVTVDFPETRATGSVMSYPLMFGKMPDSKIPQKQDPIFMMPGDTLEIPLDKHYTRIKSFVEHRHIMKDIHKAELAIGFIVFADKSGWGAGNFYRQDPNNPDHYINTGDRPEPTERQPR
jgi:hypothetical protein